MAQFSPAARRISPARFTCDVERSFRLPRTRECPVARQRASTARGTAPPGGIIAASMALITLLNAQLAFGHVPLLDHADFSLEAASASA